MISYCKRNAFVVGVSLGSECSSMVNRNCFVHGAVNNSGRVLTVNEKRTHLSAFVKKISVVTTETS